MVSREPGSIPGRLFSVNEREWPPLLKPAPAGFLQCRSGFLSALSPERDRSPAGSTMYAPFAKRHVDGDKEKPSAILSTFPKHQQLERVQKCVRTTWPLENQHDLKIFLRAGQLDSTGCVSVPRHVPASCCRVRVEKSPYTVRTVVCDPDGEVGIRHANSKRRAVGKP